jgi:hypothetical protein
VSLEILKRSKRTANDAGAGGLGNRLDRKRRGWLLIEGLECSEAARNQK